MRHLILFENYFNEKEPTPISVGGIESMISNKGKTPFIVAVDPNIEAEYISAGSNEWQEPGSITMARVNDLSKILNKQIVISPHGYNIRERPTVILVSTRDFSKLSERILDNSYSFIVDSPLYGIITNGIDYYKLK
jgi:hypothetical protein